MKKIALLAAASVAVLATPAMAHEGPYIGVIGGYDSVSLELGPLKDSDGGFMYGVIAGYDASIGGQAMAGVELEYAGSTVKDRDQLNEVRAGRDLYAGVRVGFLATPEMLVYAKGGYTNAQIKLDIDDGTTIWNFRENQDGFRLGAGIEQSYDKFAVRLEYRYSDYGGINLVGINTGISTHRHQAVAGVQVNF